MQGVPVMQGQPMAYNNTAYAQQQQMMQPQRPQSTSLGGAGMLSGLGANTSAQQ